MNKGMSAVVLALSLVLLCFSPGFGQNEAEKILKAIVKIRSQIPPDARTATVLGTEREGSGIVIDNQGHVLTIGYLILEAETIALTDSRGRQIEADFVGYDHDTGFGVVRARESINVEPMQFGNSADIQVGDPVLVAGFGGSDAVQGVRVVARREFAGYWEYLIDDSFYTIPPYAEFGGAALIGRGGKLVGIGSLYLNVKLPGLGSVASNMFVPIDLLKPILNDLIKTGRSSRPARPWLGINLEESHGRVFVTQTTAGGPAESAGLQPDDLILMVNKKEVKGLSDFYRKVWALGEAGVDVPLSILRGAKIEETVVRSSDRRKYLNIDPTAKGKKGRS